MIKIISVSYTWDIKKGEIFEVDRKEWYSDSWLIYIRSKEGYFIKYYFDTLDEYRERRIDKILK
jgi:hypothetical protein